MEATLMIPETLSGSDSMADATVKLRGLKVTVEKKRSDDDPVEALTLANLTLECEEFSADVGQQNEAGKMSVQESRNAIRMHCAMACFRFNLTRDQHEQLIRVGFTTAGVLRSQLHR